MHAADWRLTLWAPTLKSAPAAPGHSKRDHALTSLDIDLPAPSGPSSRLTKSRSSEEVAELILKAGVIKTYDTEPFVFTSGAHSPVYVNIRGLLSQVEIAAAANVDVLIGGETAGIPFAAIAASKLGLPMGYARKKAKAFGMKEMIEGLNASGRRAILVEDLTTDGQSKVSFAEQIRGCGCTLNWVASIFYYGIYPSAISATGRISSRRRGGSAACRRLGSRLWATS
jgi:orotate phosphoribosyltransferase